MEDIQWRRPTKIVSVVEMLLGLILLCLSIVSLVIVWHDISIPLGDPFASLENFFAQLFACLASAYFDILVVRVILWLIHIWAAVRLWQATRLKLDLRIALERAKFWLHLNLTILIIGIVAYVSRGDLLIAIFNLVIQGILTYIVYRYRSELLMGLSERP